MCTYTDSISFCICWWLDCEQVWDMASMGCKRTLFAQHGSVLNLCLTPTYIFRWVCLVSSK